ncbi:MAG: putative toxin-antitoxin system toxin component, PIN family [Nitrospirae bacterium]|nr:putative toxin-antitoxin system toxin component, PIN family [Nitrospirota bacterium]
MTLRVVADTNIYVSAILFGGTCESIFVLARADIIHLFLSPAIRKELQTVLGQTFDWTEIQIREALDEVATLTSLVHPSVVLSGIVAHAPDHRILECALTADADFLVTGDKKHLQPLKTFRGTRIVSPREFLNLLG